MKFDRSVISNNHIFYQSEKRNKLARICKAIEKDNYETNKRANSHCFSKQFISTRILRVTGRFSLT